MHMPIDGVCCDSSAPARTLILRGYTKRQVAANLGCNAMADCEYLDWNCTMDCACVHLEGTMFAGNEHLVFSCCDSEQHSLFT